MFEFTGSKSIFNKAEIEKVIIEGDSVTIAFREGYEENGQFIGVGSDHVMVPSSEVNTFLAAYTQNGVAAAEAIVAEARLPAIEEE